MSVLVNASTRVFHRGLTGSRGMLPSGPAMAFALALALPASAAAQSVEEAAKINLGLAIRLCIASGNRADLAVSSFTASGFAYSTRGTPGFEIWHVFTAPANTVRAEVYEGQTAPSCEVTTNFLSPSVAGPLVGTILAQLYPGQFSPSGPGPQSCATYTDNRPAIPFVVSVGATDLSAGCPALGSTTINIFSAV